MPKDTLVGAFTKFVRDKVTESQDPRFAAVGRVVKAALPSCAECHETVLPPLSSTACLLCGRTVCEEHGFFHASGACLCLDCIDANGIKIDWGCGDQDGEDEGEDDYDYPWVELGLDGPTYDTNVIKKAYRKAARATHPDMAPEGKQAEAAQRFARVQAAYAEALNIARGE